MGFRRISFWPDRPDVLSTWSVRLEGDVAELPVLLSNGNMSQAGQLPGGRHYTLWEVCMLSDMCQMSLPGDDVHQVTAVARCPLKAVLPQQNKRDLIRPMGLLDRLPRVKQGNMHLMWKERGRTCSPVQELLSCRCCCILYNNPSSSERAV
jgi:hypothetical protein